MSVSIDDVRQLVLRLPETIEQDHHGMSSFRVRGKIFATVPDPEHVRVMLGEDEIRAWVSEDPGACHEFYWGKRLACLVVDLGATDAAQLAELLGDAWLRKAPAALAKVVRPTS